MDRLGSTQVLIPKDVIGAVIGRGGAVLKEITSDSGANIAVQPRDAEGTTANERVVVIDGKAEARLAAFAALHDKADQEAQKLAADGDGDGDGSVPLKILIRNEALGMIIGKGGATIKQLSADSNTKFTINKPEMTPGPETLRIVTVEGDSGALSKALEMVLGKVEEVRKPSRASVYGAMAFPSASSRRERNTVLVLESMIGAVIGKGGINARSITEGSGAKIHIETRAEKETREAEAEADEDSGGSDERHVIIMGNAEQQFNAQQRLYELLLAEDRRKAAQARKEGRPPKRNPRRMKVHYPVAVASLGSVIGKGGSKIEEIAKSSGAKLDLIRWEDEKEDDDVMVEIFGVFEEAQAAQNLIRQVLLERALRDIEPK
mmetsp:Transcript_29345/g.76920  ORF Transcript_29345/g.76920 Transcript_29345/m.76920 type:complete len:377 (+) Transcript_29345:207-1337(+)